MPRTSGVARWYAARRYVGVLRRRTSMNRCNRNCVGCRLGDCLPPLEICVLSEVAASLTKRSSYVRLMAVRSLASISILLVAGCGTSVESGFARQCRKIAGIEVKNQARWRQYLAERAVTLARVKTTVNGVEVPSTDLSPVVSTKNFNWINDWVLRGRPSTPMNEAYRDDKYIILKATREPVARFRTLFLNVTSSDGQSGFDCLNSYPHLYTGAPQRSGSITVTNR